jgi:hypothetical protein
MVLRGATSLRGALEGVGPKKSGGGEGGIMLETIFCRTSTLYVSIFRTYKLLAHSKKKKPKRGGGLNQMNNYQKVL